MIDLTVRRFKCLNSACPAVTFADLIPGLTNPHSPLYPAAARRQSLLTSSSGMAAPVP
ncbi:hypothetical protein GCM10009646_28780 [Streptomyces aureus]